MREKRNMELVLVVIALALLACSCTSSPTSPSDPVDDAFMEEFRGYANHFASMLEIGPVRVRFDLDSNEYPHCGGMPGGDLITCKGPVPFANPQGIAAHEVCHLSGLGDEWDAELCAHNLLAGGDDGE
jgi:hypothetical protein